MNIGFQRVIDETDYEHLVFSVAFTSSNHSPFQYPNDRIEAYDEETNTVNNAVQYADYALREFFRRAKSSDYWDDTVFLVVADHNSRVYGDEVIPVQRFHIPGLILGGSIDSASIDSVASQIDLGPTLLSLSGAAARPGTAIMQFNSTQAYLEGDNLIQRGLPWHISYHYFGCRRRICDSSDSK